MADPGYIHTDHMPGRTLTADGTEYLFCSGTSYLGIPHNPTFRELLLEGMQRYGTNYSSSRHSNLKLQVYDEAEEYLAAYTGAEAALTMSSGYLAGQAVVQELLGSGQFMYAPGAHPALWRSAAGEACPTHDYDVWVKWLLQEIESVPDEHIIIVCNSLDPLITRNHTFSWVVALPTTKRYTLVIDDSHGFGVTGTDGAGVISQLKVPAHVRLVVVSSMGKAFGIPAGVILGDTELISKLKASPYFGGASGAVPAYLYAFTRCGQVFAEARQKLFSNIAFFREHLRHPELFRCFDHYPVFSTASEELCPFLLQRNILISSFRYPTPADAPITRVILSSLHTHEDLQRLTDGINQFEIASSAKLEQSGV